MYASYEIVDDRPTLRFERRLAHPEEKVWEAITRPDELEHWFPTAVTIDLRVGGRMSFSFRQQRTLDGKELPQLEGEVTDLDPPRLFAFYWGEDHLRFELEPAEAGGCVLRFTVQLDAREKAARDAAGWHVCLDRLMSHVESAEASAPGPEVTGEWSGYYEEYQRCGLPADAPLPEPAA
jgi:uncharacterized protein YndB with AHSA1/START domain